MSMVAPVLESLLTPEFRGVLREAVRHGELERNHRSHPGYPLNFPGMAAFAERCRHLDEHLLPYAWVRTDPDQQVVFTSPCGEYRLVTMAGDVQTGRVGGPGPRTRPKGPRTHESVRRNHRCAERLVQMSLPFRTASAEDDDGPFTLFLLVHRDHGSDRVRAELALAIGMHERAASSEYDFEWRELLLDEAVGDAPRPAAPDDLGPASIDFDIEAL